MKLILLMAGFGKRMRPHTWSKPKPLLSVAGKPVLGHVLDMLAGLEIEEYIFVTGWLGEQVAAYVAQEYSHLKVRTVEQKELLGQAHALWLCRDFVDGPLAVTFVDTLLEADLSGLAEVDGDGVAFIKQVPDPRRFGVAEVDANGIVTRFIEKPDSLANNNVVVGFYYVKDGPELIRRCGELLERGLQTKGEYYLVDALTLMVQAGARFVTRQAAVWEDTGKPETTLHANRWLLETRADNSAAAVRPGVAIIPPVYIAPSAMVTHSVIGPYASIGERCVVERAIISDSILEPGARVRQAVLDQALIGENAEIIGQPQRLNVGDSSTVGMDYLSDQ
jgi:glucose-1-phosphate thymidylyltransferase